MARGPNKRPSRGRLLHALSDSVSDADRKAIFDKLVLFAKNGDQYATRTLVELELMALDSIDWKPGDISTVDKIKAAIGKATAAYASNEISATKLNGLINAMKFALDTITAQELQADIEAMTAELEDLQGSITNGQPS